MNNLRAVVRNGRIILDEPTDLRDGTVLDLVVDDGGDNLDDAERGILHESIRESRTQMQAGHGIPAQNVIDELRSRS